MIRNLKLLKVPFCLLLCGFVLLVACSAQTDDVSDPPGHIFTATLDLPATSTPTAVPASTGTAPPDPSPTAPPTMAPATASPLPSTSSAGDKSTASDEKLATSFSLSDDGRWIADGWLAFLCYRIWMEIAGPSM
jgi:hypothetical protein